MLWLVDKQIMRQKLLILALLILALPLISIPPRCSAAPSPRLPMEDPIEFQAPVLVQVTVLDTRGNPIPSAVFAVFDAAHHRLGSSDEMLHASDANGKVSYRIFRSSTYYIQVLADSYLPSDIQKVVSKANVISVTFHLKRAPLPSYPLTMIRATVLDVKRHPIAVAFFDVTSNRSRNTYNLRGPSDLASDPHGHVQTMIRAGGVVHVRVQALGYDASEKIVRAKPGIISLTFILRRNGQPLTMQEDVSH